MRFPHPPAPRRRPARSFEQVEHVERDITIGANDYRVKFDLTFRGDRESFDVEHSGPLEVWVYADPHDRELKAGDVWYDTLLPEFVAEIERYASNATPGIIEPDDDGDARYDAWKNGDYDHD